MKVIIAGGRNYFITIEDWKYLDTLNISEVVCGGATGADESGKEWAEHNLIPVKVFNANWKKYGVAAGPIRNRQMAEYADAVVLFPGGKGTNNMYREARKGNLIIYDRRNCNETQS